MVQKRPYDDEDVFRISYKHPRQAEHTKELVSFSESVFQVDVSEFPHSLEDGVPNAGTANDEKLRLDISAGHPNDGEVTETGGFSIPSRPSSSTSEEESLLEPPFHMSLFPEYFSSERPVRTALSHCEDIYNLLLNHPPRKSVPIGPHHQADIPSFGARGCKDNTSALSEADGDDDQRLIGACIISMPDSTSSVHTDPKVGRGRADCSCDDKGSYSCVRKHIKEEREELAKALGPERLTELGFGDMGEDVALRWSEEEEQTFQHAVFSNPVSLGKRFWDTLFAAFSSRTKRDIVSYYFNVFMLRKRAEQNRCDPANIDSDNDEWPGSEDYGDIEVEEDDDLVVDSPTRNAVTPCDPNPNSESDKVTELRPYQISSFSCPENGSNHCPSSLNGFILEPCYAKDWDAGFMTCFRNKVDFLPTCNMIEEVFGEETKNHKVPDMKNLNE